MLTAAERQEQDRQKTILLAGLRRQATDLRVERDDLALEYGHHCAALVRNDAPEETASLVEEIEVQIDGIDRTLRRVRAALDHLDPGMD
jgi:hypothetical protein